MLDNRIDCKIFWVSYASEQKGERKIKLHRKEEVVYGSSIISREVQEEEGINFLLFFCFSIVLLFFSAKKKKSKRISSIFRRRKEANVTLSACFQKYDDTNKYDFKKVEISIQDQIYLQLAIDLTQQRSRDGKAVEKVSSSTSIEMESSN